MFLTSPGSAKPPRDSSMEKLSKHQEGREEPELDWCCGWKVVDFTAVTFLSSDAATCVIV